MTRRSTSRRLALGGREARLPHRRAVASFLAIAVLSAAAGCGDRHATPKPAGCRDDPTTAGCPCESPEPRICYSAPAETENVGACRAGLQACRDGLWGACEGEVLPRDEALDGIDGDDDDCDGETADACGELEECGSGCCTAAEVCWGSFCSEPPPCAGDSDCPNDARCSGGSCAPYGEGETEADCVDEAGESQGDFVPHLQCAWTGTEVLFEEVLGPPLVVDLDLPAEGDLEPEVLFVPTGPDRRGAGTLVAIDGRDCTERWRSEETLEPASPISAGDIDGDGTIEIAARKPGGRDPGEGGGLAILDSEGRLVCESGPDALTDNQMLPTEIADVDGDGQAEILLGLAVFDSACNEIWSDPDVPRWPDATIHWGDVPVVADVDLDGDPEVVTGWRIYDAATGVLERDFSDDLDDGLAAVADFDRSTPEPEIAVSAVSGVRIQTIEGDLIFGPSLPDLYYSGGSPPTVADLDGDGEAELAVGAVTAYVAFDPDCVLEKDRIRDGDCPTGRFDGVLWQMRTNDRGYGTSGASAFDFDRDGSSEIVYADACFARVYDGPTGRTRFIVPNANATAYEYPTVADVDGDSRAEIVVGGWGTDPALCPVWGPDLETGEPYVDTEPGLRIWEDDEWPSARAVWNEHAYSVTNVDDDGGIPSIPANNWETAGHNDFRAQNGPKLVRGVDLTVRGEGCADLGEVGVELRAVVANRGTRRAPAYVRVAFYGGPPEEGESPICVAMTSAPLEPGGTLSVACVWAKPPEGPYDVWIRVDSTDAQVECDESNNDGSMPGLACHLGIG